MEKTISAGVIITHENTILACLPFGRNRTIDNSFDLPKGKVEAGEEYIDAALREVYEETGLSLNKENLKFNGVFDYTPKKNLAVFSYEYGSMIDVTKLNCYTTFWDVTASEQVPEHVGYEIVKYEDVDKKFFVNLAKVIKQVI